MIKGADILKPQVNIVSFYVKCLHDNLTQFIYCVGLYIMYYHFDQFYGKNGNNLRAHQVLAWDLNYLISFAL